MSEHKMSLKWERAGKPFDYASYPRNHEWIFPGGETITASSAPEFFGNARHVNPEETFVAAVASCHMLTVLAICSKKRLVVESYEDNPAGFLEKNEEGKLAMTRVDLKPKIVFSKDTPVSAADLEKIHDTAHNACFIANSVKTAVRIEIA